MAMISSGARGSRSYSGGGSSYSYVTRSYTLEEAIRAAITGSLSPNEIYRQAPEALTAEFDRLSKRQFKRDFRLLETSEQRRVLTLMLEEIERAKEEAEKPVTLDTALALAAEGIIDAADIFPQLPEELRQVLDQLANALGKANFISSTPEVQKNALQVLIGALNEKHAGASSEQKSGLDLHNRAIQLRENGKNDEAIETMQRAVKMLRKEAKEHSEPTKEALIIICNRSSALAHLGDWSRTGHLLPEAIAIADSGLAMVNQLSMRNGFYHGVLLHNRAHAGLCLWQLNGDSAVLSRSRQDVSKAGEIFSTTQNRSAADENTALQQKIVAASGSTNSRLADHNGIRPSSPNQTSKCATTSAHQKHWLKRVFASKTASFDRS